MNARVPDLVAADRALLAELVAVAGGDCPVTSDPAKVAPLVAAEGVCLFAGLFTELVPAALDTWWMTVPVAVVVPSPFGPAQRDRAYRVAARVTLLDVVGSPKPGQVDLGEISLPAVVLDVRVRTTCTTT